jgi:hypothetical protein
VQGAFVRSRVIVTLPFVISSTYLIVPLVGTSVLGGGITGRAGLPDTEYSQTSPVSPATALTLETGDGTTEFAGESGGGGGVGI